VRRPIDRWTKPPATDEALGRIVRLAALLNIAYFGVEFTVATAISRSARLAVDSMSPGGTVEAREAPGVAAWRRLQARR
jgi:hypothetical protein